MWEMLKVSMLFHRIIKDSRGPPRRQLITMILLASQLLAGLVLEKSELATYRVRVPEKSELATYRVRGPEKSKLATYRVRGHRDI
ncbi:hypothetical protein F2Q70_00030929 [Brassica cretica]|uniref:Uncharacterized protein n=1 Tax=Brassica cretica TaxID=69181 RepID=A0A8S9FHN6_BRACR|nr:hypothetical protein F2Q70_00030929 [Brassica cretica]